MPGVVYAETVWLLVALVEEWLGLHGDGVRTNGILNTFIQSKLVARMARRFALRSALLLQICELLCTFSEPWAYADIHQAGAILPHSRRNRTLGTPTMKSTPLTRRSALITQLDTTALKQIRTAMCMSRM